jgi:response regulator RpfG family c-di-GMP phosphodiesterase
LTGSGWDGQGYPRGLAGEDIPLPARIAAVADVFDALTHERPYKQAWEITEAVAEIFHHGASHFDPAIVDAFARLDHDALLSPASQWEPPAEKPLLRDDCALAPIVMASAS